MGVYQKLRFEAYVKISVDGDGGEREINCRIVYARFHYGYSRNPRSYAPKIVVDGNGVYYRPLDICRTSWCKADNKYFKLWEIPMRIKKARREEEILERMIRKLKESGESRARLRDGCGDPDMKLYWRGQADAAEEIFEEIVQICADWGAEEGG